MNSFMIFSVTTGNAISVAETREDGDKQLARIYELNPDMPKDDVALIEFDEKGMPI